MRAAREAISDEERERSVREVEGRLMALPELRAAGTVLLFYSFGSEVDTDELIRDILAAGKRLYLPYLDGEEMEAAEVRRGDILVPTDYGPREPERLSPVDPAAIDLVIAPGLAFDRRGYRLGYGGGHYDRYLARMRPDAVKVGIGFASQVVDHVPDEAFDERLDIVVTDRDVVNCRSAR